MGTSLTLPVDIISKIITISPSNISSSSLNAWRLVSRGVQKWVDSEGFRYFFTAEYGKELSNQINNGVTGITWRERMKKMHAQSSELWKQSSDLEPSVLQRLDIVDVCVLQDTFVVLTQNEVVGGPSFKIHIMKDNGKIFTSTTLSDLFPHINFASILSGFARAEKISILASGVGVPGDDVRVEVFTIPLKDGNIQTEEVNSSSMVINSSSIVEFQKAITVEQWNKKEALAYPIEAHPCRLNQIILRLIEYNDENINEHNNADSIFKLTARQREYVWLKKSRPDLSLVTKARELLKCQSMAGTGVSHIYFDSTDFNNSTNSGEKVTAACFLGKECVVIGTDKQRLYLLSASNCITMISGTPQKISSLWSINETSFLAKIGEGVQKFDFTILQPTSC